ncbi:MAG: Ig-like domain-containing protein [Actinophytocola sp.]|uniref:Ig-like domain-containing protein n=1 Tax=Actinophytocola sp. TaxID=1872138 RepID=UPI003C75B2EB
MAVTAVVACVSLTGAPSAVAEVQQGVGHLTTPAQPYLNNPDPADWLGSYVVGGKKVWCVQFAHLAPDSDEQYQPGAALKTKWGTDLPPNVASDISYLLLRYAGTDSADEAAALAHLLHTWTAGPQNAGQLDPANDFRHIAYDAPFHLSKLPSGAQAAVAALQADAAVNRGPWTATVAAPDGAQQIGATADWTITVTNAGGTGVPDVPVTVTATDATFADADGKQVSNGTVTTTEDPLTLSVTPTGAAPAIDITLAGPAVVPVVQQPIEIDTQRIVSTGGEKELTAAARTTAAPPPTTTPQLPSTIPAGDTPDTPVAQAEVTQRMSGGGWVALVAVVLAVTLLTVHLARRRAAGDHQPG